MELTYKKFFEISKTEPSLQKLVNASLIAAIKVSKTAMEVFPDKPTPDVGKLMLGGLKTICKMIDFELVNKEEITADYMGEILNSYGTKKS